MRRGLGGQRDPTTISAESAHSAMNARSPVAAERGTAPQDRADAVKKSSVKNVLVVDVDGTSVKILATGQNERRSFPSGPKLTPKRMVSEVEKLAGDWMYEVVSIGYRGLEILLKTKLALLNNRRMLCPARTRLTVSSHRSIE